MNIKPISGNTIPTSERSAVFESPAMINHSILMIESRLAALESDIERIDNVLATAFDRIDALDADVSRLHEAFDEMRKPNESQTLGERVMTYLLTSSRTSLKSSEIRQLFGINSSAQSTHVMKSAVSRSNGKLSLVQIRTRHGKENVLVKNASD